MAAAAALLAMQRAAWCPQLTARPPQLTDLRRALTPGLGRCWSSEATDGPEGLPLAQVAKACLAGNPRAQLTTVRGEALNAGTEPKVGSCLVHALAPRGLPPLVLLHPALHAEALRDLDLNPTNPASLCYGATDPPGLLQHVRAAGWLPPRLVLLGGLAPVAPSEVRGGLGRCRRSAWRAPNPQIAGAESLEAGLFLRAPGHRQHHMGLAGRLPRWPRARPCAHRTSSIPLPAISAGGGSGVRSPARVAGHVPAGPPAPGVRAGAPQGVQPAGALPLPARGCCREAARACPRGRGCRAPGPHRWVKGSLGRVLPACTLACLTSTPQAILVVSTGNQRPGSVGLFHDHAPSIPCINNHHAAYSQMDLLRMLSEEEGWQAALRLFCAGYLGVEAGPGALAVAADRMGLTVLAREVQAAASGVEPPPEPTGGRWRQFRFAFQRELRSRSDFVRMLESMREEVEAAAADE